MITKQQQLEWLARVWTIWHHPMGKVFMSRIAIGDFVRMTNNSHQITREEWQQERDKIKAEPEADTSWFERKELPPVGCECEWIDESGVDGVDGVVYPQLGDVVTVRAHADTPGGNIIAIFTWPRGKGLGVAASRMPEDFRPVRTEREKAIDTACKMIGDVIGGRLVVERLYDAGLLK